MRKKELLRECICCARGSGLDQQIERLDYEFEKVLFCTCDYLDNMLARYCSTM